MSDDARRVILARRARFVAAALAGISGCRPAAGPEAAPAAGDNPSVVTIGAPSAMPATSAEGDAGEALPPSRAKMADRDGDGVADDDDRCPDDPGTANAAEDVELGCPMIQPRICLSEL